MNLLIEKPYPLFRLVQEEVPSRHHEHIDKNIVYTVYAKINQETDWYQLYSSFSENWAKIALYKLKDMFDIHICKWLMNKIEPVMFEVNDQVYKTLYVFPDQSCICGEDIAGNERYGEFNVDGIKCDYIASTVFFYYKGTCLLKCNQLFLDGELLLNSRQLDSVCKEIGQDKSLLDSSPDKLLRYIANNYESAETYNCEGYSNFNINSYK